MRWIHSMKCLRKVMILIFSQKHPLHFRHHFRKARFGWCKETGYHWNFSFWLENLKCNPSTAWLFVFNTDFWKPAQVKAFLNGVPKGKMLILDLYSEVNPVFNQTESFYGQPFVWCMLGSCFGHLWPHVVLKMLMKNIERKFRWRYWLVRCNTWYKW